MKQNTPGDTTPTMVHQQKTRTLLQEAFKSLHKGRDADARTLYRQIEAIAPDDHESLLQYGDLSVALGEPIEAIKAFGSLVTTNPGDARYLGKLGKAYLQNKQFQEAIHILKNAVELNVGAPELLIDLGAAYASINDFSTAAVILQKVVQLRPREADAHSNLAICLLELGKYDDALAHAKETEKLDVRNPSTQYSIGRIYMELGQHNVAIPHFQKAIRFDKAYGSAYHALAQCKKATEEDRSFIAKTEKVLRESIPAQERAYIHFCLGKMYGDLKQWHSSFEHYKQGNLLRRDVRIPEFPKKLYKKVKKVFAKELLNGTQPHGLETELPVFVIGMPRSGSTLIEQIIASHPQARGAGELEELNSIAHEIASHAHLKHFVTDWQRAINDTDTLRQYANKYIYHLSSKVETPALRIVDKQPTNYFYLGMIQLLFPNATIIHSVRNPLDTCLSCFFQPFRRVEWSSDLAWIGKWYCYYREIIDYWKTVLPPDKVTDIHYEELVADPEIQIRRIIDACHIEWDPVCLDFYKSDNAVSTASQWQVRQPIYRSSMKRWQPYASYLGELANEIWQYLTEEDIAFLEASGVKTKRRWSAWF